MGSVTIEASGVSGDGVDVGLFGALLEVWRIFIVASPFSPDEGVVIGVVSGDNLALFDILFFGAAWQSF